MIVGEQLDRLGAWVVDHDTARMHLVQQSPTLPKELKR
jgi:hypothetical protein